MIDPAERAQASLRSPEQLADEVFAYDCGAPSSRGEEHSTSMRTEEEKTKSMGDLWKALKLEAPLAVVDPLASDFGDDAVAPHYPSTPHTSATRPPIEHHQHVTVKPAGRSVLLDFFFQTLAVITGGYVVQKYIAPRMHHS